MRAELFPASTQRVYTCENGRNSVVSVHGGNVSDCLRGCDPYRCDEQRPFAFASVQRYGMLAATKGTFDNANHGDTAAQCFV